MFKAYFSQTYGFDEPDTAYKSLLQYYQPPNNIQGQEQIHNNIQFIEMYMPKYSFFFGI